MIKNSNLFFFE